MNAAKVIPRHRRRRMEDKDDGADWLLTYGDAVTLLMTFLVLMLSVSTIDQAKYEQVVESIKETGLENSSQYVSPFEVLKQKLDDVTIEHKLQDNMTVKRQPKGLTIEFASSSLYPTGSADIQDSAHPALRAVAETIENFEYKKFQLEVEGHTDNVAIHTLQFPSNWELSVNRATNIVRFLQSEGVDNQRMKATGYADTRPKVPNVDPAGNRIPENQAQNRRVVIHIERSER